MNRLLPTLIAPLVLSSYCTSAAATQYITVVDPKTGAMHVAVVNGAIQTQSNPGSIAPAQQITMTPPNSSPHNQGKVDVIDLNELTNAATPQIIQAILRNKEAIDRENAAFLEKQRQQLQQDSRKTPDIATPPDLDKTAGTDPIGNNNKKQPVLQSVPQQLQQLQQLLQQIQQQQQLQQQQEVQKDSRKTLDTAGRPDLDKMAENFDNLIGNIVQKTIDEKKQLLGESNHGSLLTRAQIEEEINRLEAQNAGIVDKPWWVDAKPTGTAFSPTGSMSIEELAQYAVGVLHRTNTRPELESPQVWWEAYVASAMAKNLPKADIPEGAANRDVLVGMQGQYGTPSQQSLNQLEQSLTNAATKVTTDPWASYIYVARNEVTSTVPTAGQYGIATGHYAGLVKGSLDGAPINGTLNMQISFADDAKITGSMNFGSQGLLKINGSLDGAGVYGTLSSEDGMAFGNHLLNGSLNGKLFGPRAEQVGGTWQVNVTGMTDRQVSGQFVGAR